MPRLLGFFFASIVLITESAAQEPKAPTKAPTAPAEKKTDKPDEAAAKPVTTKHTIKLGGKQLQYTATAGQMPIRNAEGEVEAHIFYMAYTLDSPPEGQRRPLMFSFNGGPGSSSVWLHLGALGPRRVKMRPTAECRRLPPSWLTTNTLGWNSPTSFLSTPSERATAGL